MQLQIKPRKIAALYIRVSTDEQKKRGYSSPYQLERLEAYCAAENIEIAVIFEEDYSAKNFDRPEWKKLMQYAKENKRKIDYVLFYAWDRFSRNIADAYMMIAKLQNLSIEPQAISQPLDLKIPQNKLVLSVYLAMPEVDNDIRAERARKGLRGSKKAGRWTGMAPIGYRNSRDSENRPLIVPNDKAPLVLWVFEQIARNDRTLNEIREELNQRALYVTRSNFSLLVRNMVYAGRIFIKANEEEPEEIRIGLHAAIVPPELFDEVQMILRKRSKQKGKPHNIQDHDQLPLRGLLNCSKCSGHMTGSGSRSRNGEIHYYYHCNKCKQERYRADQANNEMEMLLSTIQISEGVEKLYATLIQTDLKKNTHSRGQEKGVLQRELNRLKEQKDRLQKFLRTGEIQPRDYTEMVNNITEETAKIQDEINGISADKETELDDLNEKLQILTNVLGWYRNQGVKKKKQLLGSIFPEKFTFDGLRVRTAEINPTVALLLSKTGQFDPKKKGHIGYKSDVTLLVRTTGVEPAHPKAPPPQDGMSTNFITCA